MLDDWDSTGPQVEAMIPAFPAAAAAQLVADVATHEHDLRGALRAPGARHSDAVEIALDFAAGRFVADALERGWPVAVRAGRRAWGPDGPDGPPATLLATPFEALRALTGRRSLAQVRRLTWEGDREPVLDALTWGPFWPAAADADDG